MTGFKSKSEYNVCPACGRPRGVGKYEYSHGKCAKKMAALEHTTLAMPNDPKFSNLTVAHVKKSKDNRNRKKYLSGELPGWIFRND